MPLQTLSQLQVQPPVLTAKAASSPERLVDGRVAGPSPEHPPAMLESWLQQRGELSALAWLSQTSGSQRW